MKRFEIHRRSLRVTVAVVAALSAVLAMTPRSVGADALAGSAGTDTSLPATDSAVTVSGRGIFSNLKVTVNQTQHLINQAVSVTWSGFRQPLVQTGGSFGGNVMQIFQCWGDDDGTQPTNPGPPPQNCQFGGYYASQAAVSNLRAVEQGAWFGSRVLASQGWSTYSAASAAPACSSPSVTSVCRDTDNGLLWMPFHAVDGTWVTRQANYLAQGEGAQGGFWLNPYFTYFSTNEEPIAVPHSDAQGSGAELFQVDTGLEAPGLGCGQTVEPSNGTTVMPKCWLVLVPRGTPAEENPHGPNDPTPIYVNTSPLTPTAWANRIAIPLDFSPVDSPCSIGANERRIVGSELATPAITNWQPTLCSAVGSPPYNYASISDVLARQQLLNGGQGGAGMAVVSRPFDPTLVDPSNPIVYAPLTLSGVTIGFNIERTPKLDQAGVATDPAESSLTGIRVAHIQLTPRLVAKLLTESYRNEFIRLGVIIGGRAPAGYNWLLTNPNDLFSDPEFVKYNPEFANLAAGSSEDVSHLVVEQPTSDAAHLLWQWILADPEAASWMNGTADPYGMKVNPVYSTDPHLNPSGTGFGSPLPDGYPKSDPTCYQNPTALLNANNALPRLLCMLDVAPYVNSMQVAAQAARAASSGAKNVLDAGATSPDLAYVSAPPEATGRRSIVAVTDTADAARYGLQTASLSRAGDDVPTRSFIAPDAAGILAGEQAMTPSGTPGVVQSAPATTVAGAYPLTMLTYAAATPRSLDATARQDYAAFAAYGAGAGQVPGLNFGQLPPGYVPLPSALAQQAVAAAALIRSGDPAPAAPTTTTTSSTVAASTTVAVGGSGTSSQVAAASVGSSTGTTSTTKPASTQAAPAATTTTTGKPVPLTGRAASVVLRTPGQGVGAIRYTLPIAMVVAIVAAVGVRLSRVRRSRAKTA